MTLDNPFAPLEILYQDEFLVAVNKPSGLFVHRSFMDKHETFFALQMVRDQIGQYVYPIHRLDRPTSGVLLFALDELSARHLGEQFSNRHVKKTYYAICRGHLTGEDEIDYPLKEKLDRLGDRGVKEDKEAQQAQTLYQSLAIATLPIAVGKYPSVRYSLIKLMPKTGRRHQLRRHLAHLRHPIIGDVNYGDNKQNPFFASHFAVQRLMLHAARLEIRHPITNEKIELVAPFEQQWLNVMEKLGWQL